MQASVCVVDDSLIFIFFTTFQVSLVAFFHFGQQTGNGATQLPLLQALEIRFEIPEKLCVLGLSAHGNAEHITHSGLGTHNGS